MKKLSWISGALVALGTLGVPLAHADDRHYDNDRDRDHQVDEGTHRRGDVRYDVHRTDWVPLANVDVGGRWGQTVDIDPRAGEFSKLRLHALTGVAYVEFVTVRFGNGEQQHVDVKHVIGRDEDLDIALPGFHGRHVAAVTVHGRPERPTRIQIIGMR